MNYNYRFYSLLFNLNKRSPIGWIQIKEKSNDCITLSFNLYQPNVSLGAEFKKMFILYSQWLMIK